MPSPLSCEVMVRMDVSMVGCQSWIAVSVEIMPSWVVLSLAVVVLSSLLVVDADAAAADASFAAVAASLAALTAVWAVASVAVDLASSSAMPAALALAKVTRSCSCLSKSFITAVASSERCSTCTTLAVNVGPLFFFAVVTVLTDSDQARVQREAVHRSVSRSAPNALTLWIQARDYAESGKKYLGRNSVEQVVCGRCLVEIFAGNW